MTDEENTHQQADEKEDTQELTEVENLEKQLSDAREQLARLRAAEREADFTGTPEEIAKKHRWYNERTNATNDRIRQLEQNLAKAHGGTHGTWRGRDK